MYIKTAAAIFAAYECYKMLNAGAYVKLIQKAKAAHRAEEAEQFTADPFFRRVLVLELAYIVFAIILLFTPFWYYTIVLFAISLLLFTLDPAGRMIRLLLTSGSAVCAVLLMYIILA